MSKCEIPGPWSEKRQLDAVNAELFGETPRVVGLVGKEIPKHRRDQFPVFGRTSFEMFLSANYAERNMYTRVSHIGETGRSVVDKVFLDLDVDKPDDVSEAELFDRMLDDRMVADDVLGEAIADTRAAARWIRDRGWPVIGVFSGLGMHIHVLTKPRVEPKEELKTMAKKIEAEAGLSTLDSKGTREGDYNRLCRLANYPRIGEQGEMVGIYTIPLTLDELCEVEAIKLLELARTPRSITLPKKHRPEMRVYEEYNGREGAERGEVEPVGEIGEVGDEIQALLESTIQMPCMVERIQSRNPDHRVRYNCAVLMFNAGMTVDQVQSIFSRLGWVDYDPKETRKQLKSIWYGDTGTIGCFTLQERDLCLPEYDDPQAECGTYGYDGGQRSWSER